MRKKMSMPSEQAKVYINLPKPNPKQEKFLQSTTLYTAYGGARGGGKTHILRVKAFLGAVKYPGIKILIIRRTYPELQESIIEPLCKMVPPSIGAYNGSVHMMYFANGSTIKFGHFQSMGSATEYQGKFLPLQAATSVE